MRFSFHPQRLLVLLAILSSPSLGESPKVPDAIGQLLQSRNYADAIAAIDEVTDGSKADLDYLAYLKARAFHFAGNYDAALKAFDTVEAKFADSPWARRARFAKGLTYARKGDFRNAELAYRTEAEYLFSADRKQEIADIYLEYADEFFEPCEEDVDPDYAKALDFYQRALKVGPKQDTRIRVELAVARCQQHLDNLEEAAAAYRKFIEQHVDNPLVVEARYGLGETLLTDGLMEDARQAWRDLLEFHRTSDSDRLPQVAFRISETYGLPEPDDNDELLLGVASLMSFVAAYPEHELAPAGLLRAAQSFIYRSRFDEATTSLNQLLDTPRYAEAEETADGLNLLGLALQRQAKFDEALDTWQSFLTKYPTHKAWSAVQQQIIDTHYAKAKSCYETEKFARAKELWADFMIKYPLDGRSGEILYRFGEMEYKQEHWTAAIDAWRRLVSKYPSSSIASQAQLRIAITTEEELGLLEESLDEYRDVHSGSARKQAERRIARLMAKTLRIATERTFRSNETPALKIWSRNIEKVSVRVYTVDLETYFRKMHNARGVEALDIALIDPDSNFEFTVPDYMEYKQHESIVNVPLPAVAPDQKSAGVMAVTVSSDTLEATTMLIQSDLEIMVKSSRDEAFVFAQNMRTGRPWPQARLLISDGERVIADALTGEDGVFHSSADELANAEDVRVFAVAGGHTASNVINLNGLGVAQGLSDKGYIYTDRAAYRAGQIVHARGVIRKVATDTYQVEEGREYQVEVFDSRNRLLFDEEVLLNQFGAFHCNLLLPEEAPQGQYRILVTDRDKENYQGVFNVQDFHLETVQLEVDTPRTVYYRGEHIEGVIRARFYYGAPFVGKAIRYQLTDGRSFDAVTDESGEVHFKLDTRGFRESQQALLHVELPERNVQASRLFHISARGFALAAKTLRSVYLTGETFEVQVTASDAAGEPVERDLALRVSRKTKVAGMEGEVAVEEHGLRTDASGEARQTLSLKEAGRYMLRISGVDRFQNTIETTRYVTISGDDDTTRLRILADRHSFKVGDTASVRVHWREQPALAMVTMQGAKILDYRLVSLQKGENRIAIEMTSDLAPNFDLAVAVMMDSDPAVEEGRGLRFHHVSSPFEVERQMKVTLEVRENEGPDESPLQPGDDVEVLVTATDAQGAPVVAEFSLAMVEQALMDRFPSALIPMHRYFQDVRRQSAMRTESSITFNYRPKTQRIDEHLLAESERLQLEEVERQRLHELADADFDGLGDRFSQDGDGSEDLFEDYGYGEADFYGADNADDDTAFGENAEAAGLGGAFFGGMASMGDLQTLDTEGFEIATDVEQWTDLAASRRGRNGRGYTSLDAEQPVLAQAAYPSGSAGRAASSANQFFLNKSNLDYARRLANMGDLPCLGKDGDWFVVPNRQQAPAVVDAMLNELVQQGVAVFPALRMHETGYWTAALATDASGQATVRFTLPDRSTAWSLEAKGVTASTLAGQTQTEIVVRKDLFAELKVADAFTDGDVAQVVASVHNDIVESGDIQLELTMTIADKSVTQRKKIAVTQRGIQSQSFELPIQLPATPQSGQAIAEFVLSVSSGEHIAHARKTASIRPDGATAFVIAGGTATGDAGVVIQQPADAPFETPRLQITVGPSVEQSLLDSVLAPPTWCQTVFEQISPTAETATSDLMAALALQTLLGATREAGGPHVASLEAKIRASITLLTSMQSDEGGWGWGESHDPYVSARALWALSLARQAGYRIEDKPYAQARSLLKNELASFRVSDFESKTVLLHALTVAGDNDFPLANQLYRNRATLPSAALAYLALTFVEMDRNVTAEELLELLLTRPIMSGEGPEGNSERANFIAWNDAGIETRALFSLAIAQMNPLDPRLRSQIDWLMSQRSGNRWNPDRATGPAMRAACLWYAKAAFESKPYELAVWVNDLLATKLSVDSGDPTRMIAVPPELLAKGQGKHRVRFELNGRGRYTYQCVLGGFVPSDRLQSTTQNWTVSRFYEPALREFDGVEIPRGFDVLTGAFEPFRNDVTELPVGQRARVELRVQRENVARDASPEELPYLVVTEPLPGGVAVVDGSVQGDFQRFEQRAGSITFYLNRDFRTASLRYDVYGYLPGEYHASPALVRNAYSPDQMAVTAARSLTILPELESSSDDYRWTPRELYEIGKRHFEKEDYVKAGEFLEPLFNDWNLKPNVYRDTVRMLLDIHLAQGPASLVVKYFEIIIEKFPSLEIAFHKLLQVGDAYHEIGEYERSYLVFRATVQASFLRESQAAGFLDARDEFLRSVDVMSGLIREYPPEPYLATAEYALAQRIYAKAPQASEDKQLREMKVTRIDLIQDARKRLDGFLCAYPEDPAADQAAFSLANSLLDLELYESAITNCVRFAERYPESDFLDSYWYIIGFCHFARSEPQEALAMCEKVAEATRKDKRTGRTVESPNRWQAIYIMGQVHHSLGEAEAAIQEYERVKDRFVDAQQAIDFFAHRRIDLPEVTTLKPGEPARIELTYRNLASCSVTVYRIDLMKYSVLRRDLTDIANINLAGIRPLHQQDIQLGDGKDYRDCVRKLDLPLTQVGAYLIVCRGEDLHASGMVLVSPIELQMQEDSESGRVRATVRNAMTGSFVPDVHVKTIGSYNSEFVSGETDLRGVFVADGIIGRCMVIADAGDGRYAFHRGQRELGDLPLPNAPEPQDAAAAPAESASSEAELLENLKGSNMDIQVEQQEQLQDVYDNSVDEGIGGGFGGGFF